MNETVNPDAVAREQLQAFVERIERLLEKRDGIMADVREVYAELKGNGFDKTVVGQVVAARRKRAKDASGFEEASAIFDLYWSALHGGISSSQGEPSRTHTRESARAGWNVDENGNGPIRRMVANRQAIFDALEADGKFPKRDEGRTVYFLHAPSANLVKIGSSNNVHDRVRSLSNSSPVPLVLLGTVPGGLKRELELHGHFAALRVHGEWFDCSGPMISDLCDLRDAARDLEAEEAA